MLATWLRYSAISLAAVCGPLLIGAACPVAAQPAQVEIRVVEASTKAAVPFASVTLFGEAARVGVTGPDGRVTFADVVPSSYTILVQRTGYESSRIGPIELAAGTIVTVSLARPLQRIGGTAVTVMASPPPATITDADPRSRLATQTAAMLAALPGIAIARSANGSIAAQQFGFASQTGVRVDDLRVGPPGAALDLRSLPLGLFESASAQTTAAGGDLAGTVRLGLPEPTLNSSTRVNVDTGDPTTDISGSARGTAGSVGYALAGASQSTRDALQAQHFMDQTGLSYEHASQTSVTGVAAKIRVPLALSNVASATALVTNAVSDDTCFIIAATPCGYGPRARTNQGTSSLAVRDVATIGALGVSAAFEHSVWHYDVERPLLAFLGVPQPVEARIGVRMNVASLSVQGPSRRHTLSFAASEIGVAVPAASLDEAAPTAGAHHFGEATLADRVRMSPRDVATGEFSLYETELGRAVATALTLSHTLSGSNRLTARFAANALGFPQTLFNGFSAPSEAQYDCADRVVVGQGPATGEAVAQPRLTELSATYEARGRTIDASLQTYYRVERDAAVTAVVPGRDFASSPYVALLPAAWRSPLVCGDGEPAIVLRVPVIVPSVSVTGARAAVRVRTGRNGMLIATLSAEHGYVSDLSKATRAARPGAVLTPLAIPLFDGTVTAVYAFAPHATGLAAMHVLGRNDPSGRGGDVLLSAGALFETAHGTISVAETNLFGVAAAPFAGFGGPPVVAVDGAQVRALQYPLAPRALTVSYRTKIGRSSSPDAKRADTLLGQTQSSSFQLLPFPDAPPADPFAIATDNPECGPERAAIARRIFGAIASFAGGPRQPKAVTADGATLTFRAQPRPTVLIGSSRAALSAALIACGRVHGGEPADVARLGLYVPTMAEQKIYDLLYTPRVGLYVTGQVNTSSNQVTLRRLDDRPSGGAFSISANCPAERRAAAASLLQELRSAFATEPASSAPSFRLVPHTGTSASWYEIYAGESAIAETLLQCASVAGASADELARRGSGGAPPPAINYSDAWGLYVVAQ